MSIPITSLPALLLSAEYLLGGLIRVSPIPFSAAHSRVRAKNAQIAPILHPLVPFKDVDAHNIYVGAWMILTGILWGWPGSRGSLVTLGCSLFWTGAGAYSQWRAGMPFWLPVVNFGVSWVAWVVG